MPIVESQFGVHLIEVLDKGPEVRKVLVTSVDQKVAPSSKTFQAAYAKASEFAGKNTNAEAFHKAIVDQNLNKRIADNIKDVDRNIPGVEGARELVRWAYDAEKGDVSKVFEFGDKYVVAMLTQVKEKGIAPLDQVRENVETLAREQKKADSFIALLNGTSTVEQAAAKFGTQAQSAENVTFASATIPGVSREPEVVGFAFGSKKGSVSKPVKGSAGVYVYSVQDLKDAAVPADLKNSQTQMSNNYRNRVDYELFEALKEKAEITDNRAKFF
jgi:peptidyl-prolyl cis-trans isomerase D